MFYIGLNKARLYGEKKKEPTRPASSPIKECQARTACNKPKKEVKQKKKGEKMTKYEYTKETVQQIIDAAGISKKQFCRATKTNRGDFNRFMRGLKGLSELNESRIHEYSIEIGLDFIAKKPLLKRIVDFIKR